MLTSSSEGIKLYSSALGSTRAANDGHVVSLLAEPAQERAADVPNPDSRPNLINEALIFGATTIKSILDLSIVTNIIGFVHRSSLRSCPVTDTRFTFSGVGGHEQS